ncbi:MAG TPA: hypothetical protein VMR34_03095 [Candidatus Saccharimonadales bacterium]|nr:hypothetical protein [Candidatus Saccharimonadales bacterium]
MNVAKTLIGAGISASLIGGGSFLIHEGFHEQSQVNIEAACRLPKYAGTVLCRNLVTTEVTIQDNHNTSLFYFISGGVTAGIGAVGVMGTLEELYSDDTDDDLDDPDLDTDTGTGEPERMGLNNP